MTGKNNKLLLILFFISLNIRCFLLISVIIFLPISTSLFGQTVIHQEWIGLEDGLSSNKVLSVKQDSTGYIWLATSEGLDRYDGIRFKHYSNLKNSPAQLLNQHTGSFFCVGKNELWIANSKGIDVLDTEKDSIIYRKEFNPSQNVRHLHYLNGKLWMGIQLKDSSYLLRQNQGIQFDTILAKSGEDRSQHFTVNSKGVIYYFNNKKQFIQYNPENLQTILLDSTTFKNNRYTHALAPYLDSQGKIWVVDRWWKKTGPNLIYWGLTDRKFHKVEEPDKWFRVSGKADKDIFYLTDQNDFMSYLLDSKTKEIKPFRQFEKHSKTRILKDRNGNLWIGNDFKGVQKISRPSINLFKTYLTNPNDVAGVEYGMRHMIELPNGDLLMSSNKGLYSLLKGQDKLSQLKFLSQDGDKKAVQQSYHLHYDKKRNMLWSRNGKMEIYDEIELESASLNSLSQLIPNNQIVLLPNDSDTIWFLGIKNLIPIKKEKLLLKKAKVTWEEQPSNLIIYHFFRSKNQDYWLATSNGLFHFDAKGIFLNRYHSKHNEFPLVSDIIYDIVETDDGLLWLATRGGLYRLNRKSSALKLYNQKDGLCNPVVCSILEDELGYLWMGTFYGLSRFDRKQETFTNFYEDDGLPFYEFNISSRLKTNEGQLYFGGINGVISFDPKKMNITKSESPLVLTKYATYSKNGEKLEENSKNLSQLKSITLPHYNKFFRFEFALLDFVNTKKNTYSWYLDGFESEWGKPTRSTEAQYNNIPAGKYTFRLRAADYSGSWSENQIIINVNIQQAIYKTTWFISICAFTLLAIVYGWYRIRLNQVLKIAQMRNKIARDLHDDIGSALTRLSIQSQMIESKIDNKDQVKNFSSVLMNTISKLRDVVWTIDSGHDKSADLLDRMKDYAYDTLHQKEIAFQFDTKGLDPNKILTPAFRQNVYLIFKESINNIIRHSDAEEVHISVIFKKDKKRFALNISDNGKNGTIKRKSGLGIKSMKQRAKELNGSLDIYAAESSFNVLLECKID